MRAIQAKAGARGGGVCGVRVPPSRVHDNTKQNRLVLLNDEAAPPESENALNDARAALILLPPNAGGTAFTPFVRLLLPNENASSSACLRSAACRSRSRSRSRSSRDAAASDEFAPAPDDALLTAARPAASAAW